MHALLAQSPGIASAVVRHEGPGLLANRARAAMLDAVLVTLLWLVAHLALRATNAELGTWGTRALLLALPVLFLAYHVLLEGLLGTTLGKARFGLRVVDRRGRSPGPWRALRRNLHRLAPLPLALPALSSARRSKTLQHSGDVRAGTFVLPASALPRPPAHP